MKTTLLALCIFFCSSRYAVARDCTVAAGDAQRVQDALVTSGSGIVNSATGAFVVGDVGKVAFAVYSGSAVIAQTTIASYQSATRVTTTLTASSTPGSAATFVWATADSTSAITTQVNNCKNGTTAETGAAAGNVVLTGRYLVSGCIYDVVNASAPVPALRGAGQHQTIIYTAPAMTPCTDSQLIRSSGDGAQFTDFTIEGSDILYSYNGPLISVFQSSRPRLVDLTVRHWGSIYAGARGISVITTAHFYMNGVRVQDDPTGSKAVAMEVQGSGEMVGVVLSNYRRNLHVLSGSSRSPSSTPIVWTGGLVDECGDTNRWCMVLENDSSFDMRDTSVWSAIRVNPGAVLYLGGANVGAYNLASVRMTALDVAATAKAVLIGNTLRSNAGAKAVVNYGDVIDGGGNDYKDCNATTCTTKTAAQSFVGKQPVRQ